MDRSGGERGAAAATYALMVAIIALLLVGGIFALGGSIQSAFNHGGECVAQPSECGGDSGGTGNGGGGGGNNGTTTSTRPASTTSTTITAATAP